MPRKRVQRVWDRARFQVSGPLLRVARATNSPRLGARVSDGVVSDGSVAVIDKGSSVGVWIGVRRVDGVRRWRRVFRCIRWRL